jgi:hypothetical protein
VERSQPSNWVVFISHSSIDTWVAKQIAREIEECGAVPFLDEANIAVGEDFEDRILVALIQAKELLVLLTPWSLSRLYVWAEIGARWGHRIPIIGILHGLTPSDLQSNLDVPLIIKRRDFINLNDIQTYFDQLRQRSQSSQAQ